MQREMAGCWQQSSVQATGESIDPRTLTGYTASTNVPFPNPLSKDHRAYLLASSGLCLGSHPVGDCKVANGNTSVARTLPPGKPQSPGT